MALEDTVKIEITKPLPSEGVIDKTYRIEGTVKMFDTIGAPPWVYAEVKRKSWLTPEILEETDYKRGFPMPISGNFSISWKPEKTGIYEVTLFATPAPLSLPMVGVPPVIAESDTVTVKIGKAAVGEYSNLKITSYQKAGGTPVTPPSVLKVNAKEKITFIVEFDYKGSDTTAKLWTSLYQKVLMVKNETEGSQLMKDIPISNASAGVHKKETVEITAPAKGGKYGVYSKLDTTILTPDYDDVIEVVGVADIADMHLTIDKGEYGMGAVIPFRLTYKYRGPKLSGQLVFELGTGILPIFSTVYTYPAKEWEYFDEALDYKLYDVTGTITLPLSGLQVGQTYSIRATLTADGLKKDDTLYTAITILKLEILRVTIYPAGAGYVTVSPAPSGGVENEWLFPHDSQVYVTAHANPGYAFDWWTGEMTDTQAMTAPVYPMSENREITAKFKVIALETLEVVIDPAGAGTVTTSPAPSGGVKNNWLFPYGTTVYVTAHPNSGYTLADWVWSGEMTDSQAATAPVYPMTEHRRVTAHFKAGVAPTVYTCPYCGATFATQAELDAHILAQHPTAPAGEFTLTLVAMPDFTKGWITIYPDKPSYNKWDIVTLTAHGIAVYDFSYWQIDDSEPIMLNPMAMYVTANHVIRAYFV